MLFPHSSLALLLAALLLGCLVAVIARKYSSKTPPTLHTEAPEDNTKTPVESPPAIDSMPSVATSSQEKSATKNTVPDTPPKDIDPPAAKQMFDAFLVLDVEATCMPGTDFNYANEIIASRCFHIYASLRVLRSFSSGHVGMARLFAQMEAQRCKRSGE